MVHDVLPTIKKVTRYGDSAKINTLQDNDLIIYQDICLIGEKYQIALKRRRPGLMYVFTAFW